MDGGTGSPEGEKRRDGIWHPRGTQRRVRLRSRGVPTANSGESSPKPWGGGSAGERPTTEIVSLRAFIDHGGARLEQLLSRLGARGMRTFRFPKVHQAEISKACLETLGFRPAGGHLLYAGRARAE
jgi:hypothetical protein